LGAAMRCEQLAQRLAFFDRFK